MMASSRPDTYKELSDKPHAHRFTLRTGKQVVSGPDVASDSGEHVHEVDGRVTSAAKGDAGHTHTILQEGVELASGPATWPMEMFPDEQLSKGKLADGGFSKEEALLIAKLMDINVDEQEWSIDEFVDGLNEELEHADVTHREAIKTAKIALSHLKEDPEYYTKLDQISKAVAGMPDLVDPTHEYVFKTGEYGIYDYWYRDMRGNYWRYSNAPEGHKDYDDSAGIPLLDKHQPQPFNAPQFFTLEGRRRSTAVPSGVQAEVNPTYNPADPKNVWYETYEDPADGVRRFVYLDSDIRENPDLWVQYQLRVVDAGLVQYRQYATYLFSNSLHPKDKLLAAILMLVEQGLYEVEELADALVSDLQFIDENVKLLGRKIVCDIPFYDFLTSLIGGRNPDDPLFVVDTHHGRNPFGYKYLYSVFKHLRMSPHHILYWRASQMFSRVMNRLAMTTDTPPEEVEGRALSELQRMFSTTDNIKYMVDHKVRETLLSNYGVDLSKALSRSESDDFGVVTIFSDIDGMRPDEEAFSTWLHAEPMHDITPEEELILQAQLQKMQEAEQGGANEEAGPGGGEEKPAPGSDEPGGASGGAGV